MYTVTIHVQSTNLVYMKIFIQQKETQKKFWITFGISKSVIKKILQYKKK